MENHKGMDNARITLSDFEQSSTQSWSQPVRNDEASQTSNLLYGKNRKGLKPSEENRQDDTAKGLLDDTTVDSSEGS